MSLPLILACLWVIVGALAATLPGRLQRIPASFLFFSAPALLIWIGATHGYIWTLAGLIAFASMFRRALIYLVCRAFGLPARDPRLKLDETP